MLLIAMHEWQGTAHRNATAEDMRSPLRPAFETSKERYVSFATRLELPAALERIADYQRKFKQRFPFSSVEFRLLSVSTIPDMPDETLAAVDVGLVEELDVV